MSAQVNYAVIKTIRTVIVEDNRLTRIGLLATLKQDEQIEIIAEAEDAEKGLQLVFSCKPQVVLMDVGLPGASGIEATRRIKAFDEDIKVVIYTSHSESEVAIAALGAGADAYCVKESDFTNLTTAIKAVSEGATWLDPAIARTAMRIFRKTYISQSNQDQLEKIRLTEREFEVLLLLIDGNSNREIAEKLIISLSTAREHVCHILRKLAVTDRVQAAVKAVKQGLV